MRSDGNINWTLRGAGDLRLDAGNTLRAASISLAADAGSIAIAGTLDATAARGGFIDLAAANRVDVSGSLIARATDDGVRGGRVNLASAAGVLLGANSLIDVSGSQPNDSALESGGTVAVRLPATAVVTVLDAVTGNDALALGGTIRGARRVAIEGFNRYELTTGSVSSAQVAANAANPWFAAAAAFAAQGDSILAALNRADDSAFSVLPGVELFADDSISIDRAWNLFDWRFGETPGVLTIRAGGDLNVNASISDGFASPSTFVLTDTPGDSWSLRLAAGADVSAARPTATRLDLADSDPGSVALAPGTSGFPGVPGDPIMVRTGTGTIEIAAARDVTFGNQASVIYTAGVAGPGIVVPNDFFAGGLNSLAYPIDGGDVSIVAGRDVLGPRSQQLFADWQPRTGGADILFPTGTAWTIDFAAFEQGAGALGGGNISIQAGRDVVEMSASTPSIGRQVGGLELEQSVTQVAGGGDLRVDAGRDVVGGSYYADRGLGSLSAGRGIGTDGAPFGSFGPVLASALCSATRQVQCFRALWPSSVCRRQPRPDRKSRTAHRRFLAPTRRQRL
jgi:filamentous hemagglutinin